MTDGVWQVSFGDQIRWAVGPSEARPRHLLDASVGLDDVLGGEISWAGWMSAVSEEVLPTDARLLAPIGNQEVWAAGVTFQRSQAARREESQAPDHYDRVYDADRPELFLKAAQGRSRGPGQDVTIRRDSGWDVPEPEVGLVADHRGRLVALTLGNDMSSRSIEGENPLYLPQAKVYDGSCAIGPCLIPATAVELPTQKLSMQIERAGRSVFDEAISMAEMRRTPTDLLEWLFKAMTFPTGVVLLTGTGLVPGNGFTLQEGDRVRIVLQGHLTLENLVALAGKA